MAIDYLAEGRRLDVPGDPFRSPRDTDVLCVDGCVVCRHYRDAVRAALEAERVAKAKAWKAFSVPSKASEPFFLGRPVTLYGFDLALPAPRPPLTGADIERRFTYHRPEGQKITDHNDVRAIFKDVAYELNDVLPSGREASLAFTKLEEAANWAHAAIAREGK